MMNTQNLLLEDFVFCRASISQWSGKVALSFEGDLGVENGEKILNGQKAICPIELLRPFNSLDKWMRDRLDKIGVQHLGPGIWAIPVHRAEELSAILKDTQEKFDEALVRFELEYDSACESFFAGKSYEGILRHSKMSIGKVLSKFRFSTAVFQFAASEHSQGVDREALFDSFTTSIASQAREIFSRWEERKRTDELGSQSVRTLHDLRDKIKGFETISPHAFALGRHLDTMLAGLPKGAKATGYQINQAYAIVSLLKSEENLRDLGNTVLQTMQDDANSPAPVLEQEQCALPVADSTDEPDLPDDVVAAFRAEPEPSISEQTAEPLTVLDDGEIPFADTVAFGSGVGDADIPFVDPVSVSAAMFMDTENSFSGIPREASF